MWSKGLVAVSSGKANSVNRKVSQFLLNRIQFRPQRLQLPHHTTPCDHPTDLPQRNRPHTPPQTLDLTLHTGTLPAHCNS
ncbi:hypothetical protein BC835DRAFT_1388174 [Cytidiella melzeri]|nr:hypothetical protein BC835DRAFT_1388174 [Cytidiella melzeri]